MPVASSTVVPCSKRQEVVTQTRWRLLDTLSRQTNSDQAAVGPRARNIKQSRDRGQQMGMPEGVRATELDRLVSMGAAELLCDVADIAKTMLAQRDGAEIVRDGEASLRAARNQQ